MKTIHNLVQGSDLWKAHRRQFFNASDAPAMLGISDYKSRSQLVQEYATGVSPDIDASTQQLFDAGHAYEAMARPIAEEIIGEALFPLVVSLDVDGLPLSASLDGSTMGEDVLFEHKSRNQKLVDALTIGVIPDAYKAQMEQQMLIMGAEKCLFMASNGTPETELHAWYESDPAMRARLLAGWKQFQADVKAYKPQEYLPAAVAEPVKGLPALVVQLVGEVKSSNLAVYKLSAEKMIASISTDLKTDQDFANADNLVKFCEGAEKELETVKKLALGQTSTIDELFNTIDHLKAMMREKRLALNKLVEARKEQIKQEVVKRGRDAFAEHIASLNKVIGKEYMPVVPADFGGVIKSKRTIASLNDAVDTELARAKIAADEISRRIQTNLAHLRENAADYASLFPDTKDIVLKSPEDLASLVTARIATHKESERLKAEKLAKEEADRKATADAEAKRLQEAAAPAAAVATAPAPVVPLTSPTLVEPAKGAPTVAANKDPDELINAVVGHMREMTRAEQIEVLNAAIAVRTKRPKVAA